MNFTELNFLHFFLGAIDTGGLLWYNKVKIRKPVIRRKANALRRFLLFGLTEPQRRVARGRRSLARVALPLRLARAHTLPHTY